jgi:Ca-activated chloride channel family protein
MLLKLLRQSIPFGLSLLLLTACADEGSGGGGGGSIDLPDYMRDGYETYQETGGARRPGSAVDVYILYSPETQQYMPEIIRRFNEASAEGNNPITGQPWGSGQNPIFVHGQQPTTGSSGTAAQGIINAIMNPSNSNVYHPTIFQPSVSHWLALVNFQAGRPVFDLADAQATALSPVIIGIWESRLRAIQSTLGTESIGWDDLLAVLESENGWQDFGIPNGRRAVYYGHANPRISSTGLSTNISEYYACARQNGFDDRRLSLAAVNNRDVQGCVQNIERLVRHYADSTEDFLEYINRGPEYLDMIALEETDLICLNRGAQQGTRTCIQPQERLIAIYPEDGTFWHEHPFGIVNADWVTPEQQQAARIFTDFVLTEDIQQLIMAEGFRPANPNVPLDFPFVEDNGVDPDQPTALLEVPNPEVVAAIQENWTLVKRQADILLVVDTSTSMQEEGRLDNARAALAAFLSAQDTSTRIGLVTFSDTVTVWDPIDTLESNYASLIFHITCELEQDFIQPRNPLINRCLRPDGSTSLYTGIRTAIDILDATSEPTRIRAVIVLSDGQNTCRGEGCSTLEDVVSKIERTRSSLNPVIVIPIAYGSDADVTTLTRIAQASATEVQSGSPDDITDLLELLGSYF